jgi:hypothetical protein
LLGEFSKKYGKELLDLYLNGPLFPGRLEDEEEEPVNTNAYSKTNKVPI